MIAQRERKKNIPKVLIEIRMAHYEEKRKEKIRLIKEVRIKCIIKYQTNKYLMFYPFFSEKLTAFWFKYI